MKSNSKRSATSSCFLEDNFDQLPRFGQYTSLDQSRREIRLLNLLPADDENDEIECYMERVSLLEATDTFHALSYVWGQAGRTNHIVVEGETVEIRQTLCSPLRNLRRILGKPTRLWVDVLCINQRDLAERSFQVSIMGDIFRAAKSVFAWLGPSRGKVERAFNDIELVKAQRLRGETNGKLGRPDVDAQGDLQELIGREYWTRLWILQEVALAKDVWLVCGSRMVNWDDFRYMCFKFWRMDKKWMTALSRRWAVLKQLDTMRDYRRDQPLQSLLYSFHLSKCQDPRDKIYGLLAMASDCDRQSIRVDYGGSAADVFCEVCSLFLGSSQRGDEGISGKEQRNSLDMLWKLYRAMRLDVTENKVREQQGVSPAAISDAWISAHVVSIQQLAQFDNAGHFVPPSRHHQPDNIRKAVSFVYQVELQKSGHDPRHTGGNLLEVDSFIYSTCQLRIGDVLARIAGQEHSCVVLRDLDHSFACVGQASMPNTWVLGLPCPNNWAQKRLADAIYQSAKTEDERHLIPTVQIQLNFAAIVALLYDHIDHLVGRRLYQLEDLQRWLTDEGQ